MSNYIPGVCNIGPAEIRRRRDIGITGSALAVGTVAAALALGAPKPVRLLAALPAVAGVSGLLQAGTHFCAGFGVLGRSNFGELGEVDLVEQAEERAADRRKALAILGGSAVVGTAAAALTLLLP